MHVNVTSHPSADWTLQQLREVVGDADSHRYLIHDRDANDEPRSGCRVDTPPLHAPLDVQREPTTQQEVLGVILNR